MGAEIMYMFSSVDSETVAWMGISTAMLAATCVGLIYWDRYLHRLSERESIDREH